MVATCKRVGWWLAAVGFVVGGCGGEDRPAVSTSTARGTVSGVVTVEGSPLDTGRIRFNPANVERPTAPPAEASLAKDGKFTVETLVGDNEVTVTSPRLTRTAGDRFDVKEGTNTFNLDIKKP